MATTKGQTHSSPRFEILPPAATPTPEEKEHQALVEEVKRSLALAQVQAQFGDITDAHVTTRTQGLLGRPHPVDLKRQELEKTNTERIVLILELIRDLGQASVVGTRYMQDVLTALIQVARQSPPEMQKAIYASVQSAATDLMVRFNTGLSRAGADGLQDILAKVRGEN